MLRLFRQIRKSLMEQNKVRTYILYATGEFLLVVIGILIALQVNNWNEERKNETRLQTDLTHMNFELDAESIRLDTLYQYYKYRSDIIQEFLQNGTKQLTNREAGLKFNQLLDFRKFQPRKSSYEAMQNDGSINVIKNMSLSDQIVTYYERPYLQWSTQIYGSILSGIDYSKTDFYKRNDALILSKNFDNIPGFKFSDYALESDYSSLISSKWAQVLLVNCLQQMDFIFANIKERQKLISQLKHAITEHINRKPLELKDHAQNLSPNP